MTTRKFDLITWMRDYPFYLLLPCLTYASISLHHCDRTLTTSGWLFPWGISRKLGISTRYMQGAVHLEFPPPDLTVAELHAYLPRISGEEAAVGWSDLFLPTLFLTRMVYGKKQKRFFPILLLHHSYLLC